MPGSITARAAKAALNYLSGRSLDLAPTPQSLSLALMTSAPPTDPRTTQLTEASGAGYFRQVPVFSTASIPSPGQPARIENATNILFGPFTSSGGLLFPVTHCALLGSGAPAVTGNLLSANTSGSETNVSGWEPLANCTLTRSTTQAKSGAASMAVQSVASGEVRVRSAEFTSVVTDHSYRAGVWVYAAGVTVPVIVDVEWYDAVGNLVTTSSGASVNATSNTWIEAIRTPMLRLLNVTKCKFVIRITASAAGQIFYCDDMTLTDQRSEEILMTWAFDVAGQAAQNESLQISAGALSMTLG
ncbi:hypothetical protein [Streptomyces sp. NPDC017448]|uniref:phage tail fiber protein n=1 Tax=Streptomyces sp. NPDC017448 TaxID=3364996 RepID=UPI0037B52AAE